MMNKNTKIYVAGHNGLVGSAIVRNLESKGYTNIITQTHRELDLTNQFDVARFFAEYKPEVVILAAAFVGGIMANSLYRADFIMKNMQIQCNVISESYKNKVKKLLFLGSSCIYPKNANQPIIETELLTSDLEYTNEPYAIAKIAGLKMCESYNIQYGTNYIAVMPTNLYGYGDNFDLERSHVLPGMIRKMHLAKLLSEQDFNGIKKDLDLRPIKDYEKGKDYSNFDIKHMLSDYGIFEEHFELWGTGTPLREFMWSDDLADACVHIIENVNFSDIVGTKNYSNFRKRNMDLQIKNCHINIGTGEEYTIKELSEKIANAVGYKGDIVFNDSKPDGTYRKLLNCNKLHSLGWTHKVNIDEGITKLYNWYLSK